MHIIRNACRSSRSCACSVPATRGARCWFSRRLCPAPRPKGLAAPVGLVACGTVEKWPAPAHPAALRPVQAQPP
jgi:hypothetical protein